MNISKTALCAIILAGYCASPFAQTAAPQRPTKPVANQATMLQRLLSQPEDWRQVASTDSFKVFLEFGSIKNMGRYTKAWTLYSLTSPEFIEDSKWSQSSKSLEYVDCAKDSNATKQSLNYDDDIGSGNVVSRFNREESELKFREPTPGSVGSAIVKKICRIAAGTVKK